MTMQAQSMRKPKQYNSHVRARHQLIVRIVNRRYDWDLGTLRDLNSDELKEIAGCALAAHSWSGNWSVRQLGSYHCIGGYDGPQVQYKNVPAFVIHSIMCRMSYHRAQLDTAGELEQNVRDLQERWTS